MSDYLLDWSVDSSLNLENPNNGIPIPRNQHSQSYQRPDFGSQGYIYSNNSPSPSRLPLVPPNSLSTMSFSNNSTQYMFSEAQRNTLSPLHSAGSPFMISNSMDDVEIKMEPFDELLDIGGGLSSSEPHPSLHEDNLLDNVNFEDLLMTDDMDSSTTTCLDPQHSSPAAMATVHPDEVLGMMKSDSYSSHINQSFTPSMSVPVKIENASFGNLATSFPPQGIGWKDSSSSLFIPNRSPCHNRSGGGEIQRNIGKEISNSQQLQSRIIILPNEFLPDSDVQQGPEDQISMPYNNNEPLYTQLDSAANASTNSTLHDLLVNSPAVSHSPQHLQQQQVSPFKNMSPSPLRGMSPQDIPIGQSVPGAPSFLTGKTSYFCSRLSSSAPVNNFSFEQIWQRREPRQHMLSTGSLAEEAGGSTSSLSTGGGILSPIPHDFSIDESIDSEEDSDVEHYDSDSDNDSILSEEMSALNGSQSSKKERHFWQYNVQAKGPKGHRVNITHSETDPHQLDKIMDPVFSPLCSIQGIKHSGKARRGDGNDLTPSPRKLVSIGVELNKLNKKINEMTPVSELPSTVRSKSRKEKNKLASRACRLKKKAQHEANKIKLHGLEQEHKSMMALIIKVREDLFKKIELAANHEKLQLHSSSSNLLLNCPSTRDSQKEESEELLHMQQILTNQIEKSAKMRTRQRIAGFTTEFVNKVIENCRNGNPTGGLDELAQTFVKTSSPTDDSEGLNANNELYT